MKPILNKHEIDELLRAIKEGRVSLDLDKDDKASRAKSCTPLNLFQANALKDELSRIPNFDIILDNFAQNLGISLTNHLQRNFSISRTSMESSHFLDFLLDNKDVGAIAVLDISPLKQGALILIDAHMCFAMVEILLGASTEIELMQPNRKLTSIELKVVSSIITKGCDDLDRSFSQVIELNSSLLKIESNSRLVSITDPDAEILVGVFKIATGEVSGEMKIVFPVATLDPLVEGLKNLLNVSKSKKGLWTEILEKEVVKIETELIAQSGYVNMSINEVLALKQGDIIYLDYNPNSPLNVLVEDKPKFYAVPGTHNGKKAISITGIHELGV